MRWTTTAVGGPSEFWFKSINSKASLRREFTMPIDVDKIANFFLRQIIIHPKYNSVALNADMSLLYPPFSSKVQICISQYKKSHSGQDIAFTETYRSNALQLQHFNNGASKIKKDGMHHFGIAADSIFVIGGKRTYKGDVVVLRKIFADNGLFLLGMWDALHVQFIPVNMQAALRSAVKKTLLQFQGANGLNETGEADASTIAAAKGKFG